MVQMLCTLRKKTWHSHSYQLHELNNLRDSIVDDCFYFFICLRQFGFAHGSIFMMVVLKPLSDNSNV